MRTLHRAIFSVLMMLGVAWGGLLCVGGWYVLNLGARTVDDRLLQMALGVTALTAGNFVFMAIVAGRVVQTPNRVPLDFIEFATAGLMLAGAAVTAYLWLAGGGI